jgi:hypothetical protein
VLEVVFASLLVTAAVAAGLFAVLIGYKLFKGGQA